MVNPCWGYKIKEQSPNDQQVQIRVLTKVSFLQFGSGRNFFTWQWFKFREATREILRSFLYFICYIVCEIYFWKIVRMSSLGFSVSSHLHPSILTCPQPRGRPEGLSRLIWEVGTDNPFLFLVFFTGKVQTREKERDQRIGADRIWPSLGGYRVKTCGRGKL